MNKLTKLVGALLLTIGLGSAVVAGPIQGSIGFTAGAVSFDANGFNSITDASVDGDSTGDYTGVNPATVTMSPFQFSDAGVDPLWTFDFNGSTYSFVATSITGSYSEPFPGLKIALAYGYGIAYITGAITDKDPTYGKWVYSANSAGSNFTFSASTTVPEGSTTALLLGLGLLVVGFVARRGAAVKA